MDKRWFLPLLFLSVAPVFADNPEVPSHNGAATVADDSVTTAVAPAEQSENDPAPEVGKLHHDTSPVGQLRCRQKRLSLYCDFRPKTDGDAARLQADLNGEPLPQPSFIPLENQKTPVHVLIMVDTSDPRRQSIVNQHTRQIKHMVRHASSDLAIGVSGFDHGMKLITAPALGVDVAAAAEQLHAAGKMTELYRSLLQGIDLLAALESGRRAIFIFSDGMAEDKAYDLPETVESANAAGVVLYSIGYVRSVSDSINLQTLRRLAEETGGEFYENTRGNELPTHFPDNPFASLFTGGIYIWDMSAAAEQPGPVQSEVNVYLAPAGKDAEAATLLTVPVTLPRPAVVEEAMPPPSPPAPVIVKMPEETKTFNKRTMLLLILAVLLLLLILTLISREVLKNRSALPAPAPGGNENNQSSAAPYGYLIIEQPEVQVYKITRMPWRMGRAQSNDMVLDDASVSRHHAEINYKGGGHFELQDLNSSNGVFVNNKKVEQSPIKMNDFIEIGDIKLRFTQADPSEPPEEETVFIETRMPDA